MKSKNLLKFKLQREREIDLLDPTVMYSLMPTGSDVPLHWDDGVA